MSSINYVFVLIVIYGLLQESIGENGIINLDEHSFSKILNKFDAVMVKFDIAYPYGEKHDIYERVARELSNTNDLIFATVGVRDYGDKENTELAKKYGLSTKDDLPAIRFFSLDKENPTKLDKDGKWSDEAIKKLIKDNTNIYVGLPGCLEAFDKLAMEFVGSENKKSVLDKANTKLKGLTSENEKKTAIIYTKYMSKILDADIKFVPQEQARLQKIINEGKISDAKKMELSHRLNILLSLKPIKTEL